jgi:hypothetical protein
VQRQILVQLVDALHLQLLIAVAFDFAAHLTNLRFRGQHMVQLHLRRILIATCIIFYHFRTSSLLHQPLPLLDDHFVPIKIFMIE